MKKYMVVATVCAALVACKGEAGAEKEKTAAASETTSLESEIQKASYAIGMRFGEGMGRDLSELDIKAFYTGFEDGFNGRDPKMTPEEMVATMQALQAKKMQEQQIEQAKAMEENQTAGVAFLEKNKAKEGVAVTESGLQYEVITKGEGESPDENDKVKVHYHGTLPDGTVFDSSIERGEPITFAVGGVIPGWTEAMQMMKVGDKWKLTIPSDLAYGERGAGPKIGPNQVLVFEVELLGVEKVD